MFFRKKCAQRQKFRQNGEILPNLVTLMTDPSLQLINAVLLLHGLIVKIK
jgi:hypothetical protein